MIETIFDNNLNIPPIKEALYSGSLNEDPEHGNDGEMQQTKITGIVAPLVRINTTTCNFSQVKYMQLRCNKVPEVDLEIEDQIGVIQALNQPTSDNSLQIQIIPPFDNAYKKINLLFYMDKVDIEGDNLFIHGIYNPPKFQDTIMKAFGKTTTYKFFEQCAHDLSLGFCSNTRGSDDERYIYIPNRKYEDSFDQETQFGGSQTQLFEWWIDWWNNLNFIDIYKQYNTIYKDEDLQIWIPGFKYTSTEAGLPEEPQMALAMATNAPSMSGHPLYIDKFEYKNTPIMATDRIFEIYDMQKLSSAAYLIQDGDVKNDIFIQYEYGGEKFGEFNYLTQKACRNLFLSKIDGQRINIEFHIPMFSLLKGEKINVYWYDINPFVNNDDPNKRNKPEITSNIELPEDAVEEGENKFFINKQVSGQYYIIDSILEFERRGNDFKWTHHFELGRPLSGIQNYITKDNEQ